eukprot:scaffold3704_cov90-Cylindrotheca_fusiformis.AAC.1
MRKNDSSIFQLLPALLKTATCKLKLHRLMAIKVRKQSIRSKFLKLQAQPFLAAFATSIHDIVPIPRNREFRLGNYLKGQFSPSSLYQYHSFVASSTSSTDCCCGCIRKALLMVSIYQAIAVRCSLTTIPFTSM